MIICHCTSSTDRDIRRAAANGEKTCRRVAEGCGAGTECKGCVPAIIQVLRRMERDTRPAPKQHRK